MGICNCRVRKRVVGDLGIEVFVDLEVIGEDIPCSPYDRKYRLVLVWGEHVVMRFKPPWTIINISWPVAFDRRSSSLFPL